MDPLPRSSTDLFCPDDNPEEQSAAYYDSAEDEEEEASRHQVLWADTMAEGRYQSLYDKVAVLLLSWKVSDLDTTREVEDLGRVFVDDFGYHAMTEYLNANSKQKLQVQVNARVAKFVEDCDGLNTLLIVYYAGHGLPGEFFGDLQLTGLNDDNRDANQRLRNRLVWNKTEDLLRPAEADVLEIFDCGYAGTLGLVSEENPLAESYNAARHGVTEQRSFEYLAAAEAHGMTGAPGPTSFTRALIFALTTLARDKKEGGFTTDELLRKIKTDAPHFPKDQTPVMSNRDNKNSTAGRIMLHPLQQHKRSGVASEESPIRVPTKYVLTLHFEFVDKPPDDHLITIGRNLNKVFQRNTVGVHRIRWDGLEATAFTRATRKVKDWMMRGASSRSQRPTTTLPSSFSSTGRLTSSVLGRSAVAFDVHDSGGDSSSSAVTRSSATTLVEIGPNPSTKDELSLLEAVGESPWKEKLKAVSTGYWKSLRLLRRWAATAIDMSRPRVPAGCSRIEWTCDCGQAMYWDIKRMSSSKEADLTAYLQGHTTRPGPVFSEPQQGGNLQQRRPYASMPIQGGTGQALSPSANPQPPSNTYSPQNHTSSLIQMVLEPCFLELCVNTGEYERSVSETDITHIGSDGDLFELIASSYYTLRAERNFLQLWHPKAIGGLLGKRMFRWSFLKPTAIVFRKFMLDTGTTIALCEEGIPPPSEVLLQRYQYKPCPLETGELPMPDHLFFHLFYKPAGHSSSKWMNRLPKKIRESIFNDTAEVPVAWGIHILESTDYSVVFLILLVGMLVSGAFGVIWAWLRTDVQGGFTIGGYIVTVQAMWMAAMFSKWSRE